MAVSYVGVTTGNSAASTSTSFVTTLPAGWTAGDVAVVTGHARGSTLTMSMPAGWTAVPGPTWPVAQGSNSRAWAWYRVLQAGDTAPTITNSGAVTGGWSMTVYRGADSTTPIGQAGTAAAAAASVTMPTLTGVLAGSALAHHVHAGVSTGTIPTNIVPNAVYTEVADHATSRTTTNANQRHEAAYRLIASAGNYGGESTAATGATSMAGILIEVEQATATSVTGTLDATLPALSTSAAGAALVTGTLAATLPALSTSATGTVKVTGTEAATLPALSTSATGTVKVTGTLAATLPALVASLTGSTAQAGGNLAATLPALSTSATGTVKVTGTEAATLPALSTSATGTVKATGPLAATLPALTAALTADVLGAIVPGSMDATHRAVPMGAATAGVSTTLAPSDRQTVHIVANQGTGPTMGG